MHDKDLIKKLMQTKSKYDFNNIVIKHNITPNKLPKHVIEHYKCLCKKHIKEAKKNPLYEESPLSHSDPREAFTKK